jgi:OmpA-OmpF porin, OOP family
MMKQVAVFAVLSVFCLGIQAEGGYVGASFGQAKVTIDDLGPLPVTESKDESASAYKIFVGMEIKPNLAIEGGYFATGDFKQSVPPFNDPLFGPTEAKMKVSMTAFFVDLVGKVPLSDSVNLFGKGGLALTSTKVRGSGSGIFAAGDESASEVNPRAGIGFEFKPSQSLGVRFEFERTAMVGDKDNTGESDVDYMGLSALVKF